MTWKVERWGGGAHHKRRVVFLGSEDKARARYYRDAPGVKRGILELVGPSGGTVARTRVHVRRRGVSIERIEFSGRAGL